MISELVRGAFYKWRYIRRGLWKSYTVGGREVAIFAYCHSWMGQLHLSLVGNMASSINNPILIFAEARWYTQKIRIACCIHSCGRSARRLPAAFSCLPPSAHLAHYYFFVLWWKGEIRRHMNVQVDWSDFSKIDWIYLSIWTLNIICIIF